MAATKKTISNWFDQGITGNHDVMFVVCDTFSYEYYPVYCQRSEFAQKYEKYNSNMQQTVEVYNFSLEKALQINKQRAYFPPE